MIQNIIIYWMILTGQLIAQPMDFKDRYANIHLGQIVSVEDRWWRGFGKVRQYGTVNHESGIDHHPVQFDYVNVDFFSGKQFSYTPYDIIIYREIDHQNQKESEE